MEKMKFKKLSRARRGSNNTRRGRAEDVWPIALSLLGARFPANFCSFSSILMLGACLCCCWVVECSGAWHTLRSAWKAHPRPSS